MAPNRDLNGIDLYFNRFKDSKLSSISKTERKLINIYSHICIYTHLEKCKCFWFGKGYKELGPGPQPLPSDT